MKFKYLAYLFIGLGIFTSCSDDGDDVNPDDVDTSPITISFRDTKQSVAENNTIGTRVFIDLSRPAFKEEHFTVKVETLEGTAYGKKYTTDPVIQNGDEMDFTIPKDSSYIAFHIIPVNDDITTDDTELKLTITNLSDGLEAGNNTSSAITIREDENKQLFAYTSFEEPSTTIDKLYYDTYSPLTNHDLDNHPDQPTVNYVSVGEEIGFKASYINTRDSVGLTDGDYVGVTKATVLNGGFPDGDHGYEMSDIDGRMVLTFDAVDISQYLNVTVQASIWVYDRKNDGVEYDYYDYINMYVIVDGEKIPILETNKEKGDYIDQTYPNLFNKWNIVSGVIEEQHSSAQLVIEVDNNSINEIVYFDNIQFYGVK